MSIHLKRTVFFFCILSFGLGSFPGNRAVAQEKPKTKISIPNILNQFIREATREISGLVWDLDKGEGLQGVGIYDKTKLVAVTDNHGFYKFDATAAWYTLIPQQIDCYQFTPPSIEIPANKYNQENQNFTAQIKGCVTIRGKVKWLIIPNIYTAAMEACATDGSPCERIATDVDGNYSIPVPVGWTGTVKPFSLGFEFNPVKRDYVDLKENKTLQDYVPFVCTGAEDSIVGKWDFDVWYLSEYGGQLEIKAATTGSCDYVGKVTKQGSFWITRGMKIGDEVWWLRKQSVDSYLGTQLVKGTEGIMPLLVRIKGNKLTDGGGGPYATKVVP